MKIFLTMVFISKRINREEMVFYPIHITIYFGLLAEHFQYEQKKVERAIILRMGIWGLNNLYKTAF